MYPKKERIISQARCFREGIVQVTKTVDFDTSLVPTHSSRLLDGKCAFRFVFNASSPKPGSLVDTLTCNELPGEMENFHKKGEGGWKCIGWLKVSVWIFGKNPNTNQERQTISAIQSLFQKSILKL